MSGEWITHNGGECPYTDGMRVEVLARDGHQSINDAEDVRSLFMHDPKTPGWDIIAYRVVSA